MSFSEWKSYKLDDLVDSKRGISYGIVQPGEFVKEGGVPILKVNNLTEKKVGLEDIYRVSEQVESKFGRTRLRGNEILISVVGSIGHLHRVTKNEVGWNVVRAIAVLPIREDVNRDWVYWCLKSPILQTAFQNRATVTVQATLNIKELKDIEIPFPDSETQTQIASILSSLDDKIELNRQTNQTLEAIAQALFKEMCLPKGGELPNGWKVGKFEDVATQVKETISPAKMPEKLFHHYSLPAYDDREMPAKDLGVSILSNKTVVKRYSVLFSKLNPRIPRIWSIGNVEENVSVCSTEFIGFLPKKDYLYSFINFFLKQTEVISKLTGHATGTSSSHQRIKPDGILGLELVIPSNEQLKHFDKIVRPLLETRFNNIQQNQTLTSLRDGLLPKLMKGEIEL